MEIMTEFFLTSPEFPVEEVYRRIGVAGECQRLTEKEFSTIANGHYTRNSECSITYSTGYIKTKDVKESIRAICDLLSSHEEQIVACIQEYQLIPAFCIVINLTDNPIIELPIDFIEMASRLHAAIVVDSYVDLVSE